MQENILVLDKVTKKYRDFIANDNISITFKKGEIHAILGENGAGKTTLTKSICGFHKINSGRIILKGKEVKFKDSRGFIDNGIGMVFQHFMLIPQFTAVQNIILGCEDSIFGFINYKHAKKKIVDITKKHGLKVDLERKIRDLSVSMEQKIEILKVLYRNAEIIIFDEPTAVLAPNEIDGFLDVLKVFAKEGHTIIFITHKIKEIKSVAKSCTIMRLGKVVKTVNVFDISDSELTRLMIGKKTVFKMPKIKFKDSKFNVLEVKNLKVKDNRGILKVKDVNFNLRSGEIFGIAGIEGSGQEYIVDAILGLRNIFEGDILKRNLLSDTLESIKGLSVKQIIDRKIGNIPLDRQKHGLVLEFNIMQNIGLKSFDYPYSRYFRSKISCLKKNNSNSKNSKLNFLGFIKKQFSVIIKQLLGFDYNFLKKLSNQLSDSFDIRPRDVLNKVKNLSGGNQQKVILAREVNLKPDILLALQPTRGLDIGSVENIYKKFNELRNTGTSILLVSFELDELIKVCDRIAVMHDGKIVEILENSFDIDLIGQIMIGLRSN